MIRYTLAMLAAALLCPILLCGPVSAEKLTVTDRQQILCAKMEKAWKSGQLSLKEYEKLQKSFIKFEDRIERMKANNGGRLSYDNIESLERDLNGISVSLHKKQLAKRVAD